MFVGPALQTTAYYSVLFAPRDSTGQAARFWHDLRHIELARTTNVWAAKNNRGPWEERSCAEELCKRFVPPPALLLFWARSEFRKCAHALPGGRAH